MPATRIAKRKVRKSAAGRKGAPRRGRAAIEVSEQERKRLIDDVAYFLAERYRCVESEGCREQDRRTAREEIEAVLKRCCKC